MLLTILLLLFGIFFLYKGALWVVGSSVKLASLLSISSLIIALTVVAFGTSAPELAVGFFSTLKNKATLSLGNILGANLINISLILGLSALFFPLRIKTSVLKSQIPFLILSILFLFLSGLDGKLARFEAIIFLLLFLLFIYWTVFSLSREDLPQGLFNKIRSLFRDKDQKKDVLKHCLYLVSGLFLLVLGAKFLVDSSLRVALGFHIPEIVIGITLVAFGTTLPELATAILAAFKKQGDISLGNVIGSCIFNILFILGAVSLISPLSVPLELLKVELPLLLVFSLILSLMFKTGHILTRLEGGILILGYLSYIGYLFWR